MSAGLHPLQPFLGGGDGSDMSGLPPGPPPGRPAKHPLGVSWQAPWEEAFAGFPEHARRCALALHGAGVPVHLRSFDAAQQIQFWGPGRKRVERQVGHLLDTKIAQYVALVHMFVPTETRLHNTVVHARMEPDELRAVNAHRVIYAVWERQNLPKAAVGPLNTVAQTWVACEQNRRVLVEGGVKPEKVRVVPVPYFPDDPLLALNARPRDPKRPVIFYHIGKWEPRKEHRNIVGAFLLAFRPRQAGLVIKTSLYNPTYDNYPSVEASLREWLMDERVRANGWTIEESVKYISFIRHVLEDEKIVALHQRGDVYVSLSRGEGFDMPAFDAKLAGNLLVYTPSGGPQDFAGAEDLRVEPTGTAECHPWYKWDREALWLDYSIEDAAKAMRAAREKILKGKRCRGVDLAPFSAEAVGRRMRAHLEELHGVQEFA